MDRLLDALKEVASLVDAPQGSRLHMALFEMELAIAETGEHIDELFTELEGEREYSDDLLMDLNGVERELALTHAALDSLKHKAQQSQEVSHG